MRLARPEISLIFQSAWLFLLAIALSLTACAGAGTSAKSDEPAGPIGLFTSLPIFWAESDDLRGLLRDAPPHWALTALRRHGEVRPIDSLMPQQAARLDEVALLIMAQPRALAPQENVALDRWVRAGGRLLLFADPLLTEESAFGLGDRRRPQDVVLLSPLLGHWGFELELDEDQLPGERTIEVAGGLLPVNLPGHLRVTNTIRGCVLFAEGIGVRCRIGKGQVLIIADAALLEKDRPDGPDGHRAGLETLLAALGIAQ